MPPAAIVKGIVEIMTAAFPEIDPKLIGPLVVGVFTELDTITKHLAKGLADSGQVRTVEIGDTAVTLYGDGRIGSSRPARSNPR